MKDTGDILPRDAAMNRPATAEEQKSIESTLEKVLDEGALGLGMGITYTPTATPDEILNLFYLAAKFKRPVFVHMRAGNVIASLQEVIANAAATGAPLHIVHRPLATRIEQIKFAIGDAKLAVAAAAN